MNVALWFQIAEQLQKKIEEGVLRSDIADGTCADKNFEVNRHTARRAIKRWKRGMARIEQGRGSFVRGQDRLWIRRAPLLGEPCIPETPGH